MVTLAMHRTPTMLLTVEGGLHYLKGNATPYFSLTCWAHERHGQRWINSFAGCCHDEILRHFPRFADLAALHMSDIDGAPMHTLENGFYHLGGTKWQAPNYSFAAEHFRIGEDEARRLTRDLFGDGFSETGGFLSPVTPETPNASSRRG